MFWRISNPWTLVLVLPFLLDGCATSPLSARMEDQPEDIENVCAIFNEKREWIDAARASYNEWGLPIELMMAIMRYESSFIANARPLDATGRRLSSAYGYAQALDGTWRQYMKEVKRKDARRDDFATAIHFVGWYANGAMDIREDLSPYDAITLYVLYHDGWTSLGEDRDAPDSHVLEVATKVYKKTLIYHNQLRECPRIAAALYRNTGRYEEKWF